MTSQTLAMTRQNRPSNCFSSPKSVSNSNRQRIHYSLNKYLHRSQKNKINVKNCMPSFVTSIIDSARYTMPTGSSELQPTAAVFILPLYITANRNFTISKCCQYEARYWTVDISKHSRADSYINRQAYFHVPTKCKQISKQTFLLLPIVSLMQLSCRPCSNTNSII